MNTVKFLDNKGKNHFLKEDSKVSFRPGVYVLVKNSKDEYLLIVDAKSNKWEISGGGLDIGEDLIECGIREVKEETGYDIQIKDELPFFIEKDLAYSKKKDKFEHCINFFFMGELISEKQGKQNFAKDENILEVKFFSKDELKKLDVAFWHKNALKDFLENN